MQSNRKWRTNPVDVSTRLEELGGLTIQILAEAGKAGEMGRANTTENHPPLHGPFNAYAEATAALRGLLRPLGWARSNKGGYAITISPDGKHAIVVAAGDENTGSHHSEPKTRSPKGPRTEAVVSANFIQTTFLREIGMEDIEETVLRRREEDPSALTWIFLIASMDNRLKMELSLPIFIGEDGRPERWPERIILPDLDLSGGPGSGSLPSDGDDFDVDVIRLPA